MSSNGVSRRSAAWVVTLLAAVVLGAAAAAASPNSYVPGTPAHKLLAVEATITAQRDALPRGATRTHLDRALKSLDWALADIHWTTREGFLAQRTGATGLRDLQTTVGRLTWVGERAAYEQDVVAIVSVLSDIAHHRWDEVSQALAGDNWSDPDTLAWSRAELAADARDLREADAARDGPHAALVYVRAWQRLVGFNPWYYDAPSFPTLGDETPGTADGRSAAGIAHAYAMWGYPGVPTGGSGVKGIRIYVGERAVPNTLLVGIYGDDHGHPGVLWAQGRLEGPTPDAWNVVPLSADFPAGSSTYWIAFLAPAGAGAIDFRHSTGGVGMSETGAGTGLTELPSRWTRGPAAHDGPLSAYGITWPY